MLQSQPQRYAIWLMPAQPDCDELQARIQTLRQRFDEACLVFPPPGERGWDDIAGWKTVYTQKLR